MAGEEVYKQALRNHNEYVSSVASVKIYGMSKDAIFTTINVKGTTCELEDYIETQIEYIQGIKETKKTNMEGYWLIVCAK
eukprot:11456902-Ditylum_brightwellii.AAC.1